MRIAQVSPLHESVPPRMYGGTERVVSYLTEELVRQGHEVTLFASGDSQTSAKLIPCWPESLRLAGTYDDPNGPHVLMMEQVFARADHFDIIHFHTEYLQFPLARRCAVPSVTTLHGRLDLPYIEPFFREYIEMPLVSISNAQRSPIAWANWQRTVYHGLPGDLYTPGFEADPYLVFTGRIAPEKRPDRAIEIARRAGMDLVIAAKVSVSDRPYFEQVVRPLLDDPGIHFIGEVDEGRKHDLLRRATAMLFPIDWPEPFGLVMIEAMACGTPVIACPCGSVPEVLAHGRSGFIVNSMDEAVQAVELAAHHDRRLCRQCFDERFTAERMARDYLDVYRQRSRGLNVATAGEFTGAVHERD